MVDRELRSADEILQEEGRAQFSAKNVVGAESATAFAAHVPTRNWIPVDIAPKVSNVERLIGSLGGEALYGRHFYVPVRELLQNALDAIHAMRAIGALGPDDGEIQIEIRSPSANEYWLDVTDNGVGMSKYVLTNVLLDFG